MNLVNPIPHDLQTEEKDVKLQFCQATRVFSSNWNIPASARGKEFRGIRTRDSERIVDPFMRDANYASRNFATLGPSGIQPPLTNLQVLPSFGQESLYRIGTGQDSISIHTLTHSQRPMFLLNSRPLLLSSALSLAHVLPKIPCKFAEFLMFESSLALVDCQLPHL